jgi:hypothetical protein
MSRIKTSLVVFLAIFCLIIPGPMAEEHIEIIPYNTTSNHPEEITTDSEVPITTLLLA